MLLKCFLSNFETLFFFFCLHIKDFLTLFMCMGLELSPYGVGWIGLVLAIPKRYDTCMFVSKYQLQILTTQQTNHTCDSQSSGFQEYHAYMWDLCNLFHIDNESSGYWLGVLYVNLVKCLRKEALKKQIICFTQIRHQQRCDPPTPPP